MRNTTKANVLTIIFLFFVGALVSSLFVYYGGYFDSKSFTIKNNSTRDYKFEHYCDSIYEVNPDYYLDVLVETDEFQDYIEKHGQWWDN